MSETREADLAELGIRQADAADLPAITEVYDCAILITTAAFDSEPKTLAQQEAWFAAHGGKHPILVAELDGRVVAWAALSA
jgi:phosphinothricin acetyltransferase